MAHVALAIESFPANLRSTLYELDEDKSGFVEGKELADMVNMYADMRKASKDGCIAISTLPKELHATLKVFDQDGDGTIAPLELARAAELYADSKNTVKRLTRLCIVIGLLLLATLGAIGGLMAYVIEMAKETKTSPDGVTTVKGSTAVSQTAVFKSSFTLHEMADAPYEFLNSMQDLVIPQAKNDVVVYYKIEGYKRDMTTEEVTLFTMHGDSVIVDLQGLVTIKDADGKVTFTETKEEAAKAAIAITSATKRRKLLQSARRPGPPPAGSAGSSMGARSGDAGPRN